MRALAAVAIACALAVSGASLARGHPQATDQASAAPASDALTLTGRVGGPPGAVVADGSLAYASVDLHLLTFDLADPDAPRLVAISPTSAGRPVPLTGNLERMVLDGNRLYGLVDWDRQPPVGDDTTLRLVVFERDSDPLKWTVEGSVDLPAYTLAHTPQPTLPDMFVEGNRVYVAGYESGTGSVVAVTDVSEAEAPRLAGRLDLPGVVAGLAASGNYVYAAGWTLDQATQLRVFDVADAAAPRQVGEVQTVGRISDIVVAEGRAFVIGGGGLEVFDLADPVRPRSMGAAMPFPPRGGPPAPGPGPTPTPAPGGEGTMACYYWSDAEWQDGYLYAMTSMATGLMSSSSYLWRIDVRDPALPAVLGSLEIPDGGESLSLGVRLATIGDGPAKVVDLSDPERPRVAATLADRGRVGEVVAGAGNLAVRTQAYGVEGAVEFIDLGDEQMPRPLGALPLDGTLSAQDIVLDDHIAYVAARDLGVLVVDGSDPGAPQLVAAIPPVADVKAVAVAGSTAFVAEADSKVGPAGALRAFDVADPRQPTELGRLAGNYGTVAPGGAYVYAGLADAGEVDVIDAGTEASMRKVGDLPVDGPLRQLQTHGSKLYALTADTLYVLDIGDPSAPRPLGQMAVGGADAPWTTPRRGMAVRGDVVYLGSYSGLQVVDVHDPAAPQALSLRQVPGVGLATSDVFEHVPSGGDVAVAGDTVLFAGDGTGTWTFGAGTPDGMTGSFEGLYRGSIGYSDFAPDYAGCPLDGNWWWYLVPSEDFQRQYQALRPGCLSGAGSDACSVWVHFEGRVTPPMTAGNPSNRSRSITVTRLVDMRPASECGGPPRSTVRLFLPYAGFCPR